jgi:hypothetical protein
MALRSRSTTIIVIGAILVMAIGAWLWMRTTPMDTGATADGSPPALASVPSSILPASTADIDTPASATGAHDTSRKPIAESPGHAQLSTPSIGARAGARPLSAEGERRLDKFLTGLRNTSSNAGEFELLGRSEPADPDWSPRLEMLIQQTIDRHAHEFGRLEIGRPRCSKSLCMLTAVATTRNPQQLAQADFQRLIYTYMMPEPWFHESFFDANTTVAGDETGDVYVSYFIRK